MSLPHDVQTFLAQLQAEHDDFSLSPTDKIVTAVSGGPDSLTLLHLLAQRSLHPAENIIAAHLDHQLRPTSAREAQQVCRIAAEWGITCRMNQIDVEALSQQESLSLEEAGRQARYRFFAEVAAEFNARYIFTGHHADDQVETVLMHLLRGSGSAGLRGIRPFSPLAGHPGRWVVRPLLNTSREQIEAYCERHQLEPILDESNTDTTFFRNRLRHELLPFLETYNPQIRARLQAMTAVTAADYDWLQQQTAEAWNNICLETGVGWVRLSLADWQQLPLSLRRSALRTAVAQLRPTLRDVGFQTIEQARHVAEQGLVGTEAVLPGEITLSVGYTSLLVRSANAQLPPPQLPQLLSDKPQPLPIPGQLPLANGWLLTGDWAAEDVPPQPDTQDNPWTVYLDIGETDSLVVRPRLPGERFQPLGMNGHTKSVKETMIDRKIPAQLRPRWPIVASSSHLLWIAGHLIDQRACLHPNSRHILKLSLVHSVKPKDLT
ncbi:MAG: tRNA lysidine(34) synthetase TilS [Candidatus Promineifilaceae bacterium]